MYLQQLLRNNANYLAITPFNVIQWFKVADFGTSRKPICDFLLVINSSLPLILRSYQVVADYWSNFRCLTLTPPLGVIPCEYPDKLFPSRNSKDCQPDAENLTIVSLFLWTPYRNVTDGRTDRRNPSGYYSAVHCGQCGRAVKTDTIYSWCVTTVCDREISVHKCVKEPVNWEGAFVREGRCPRGRFTFFTYLHLLWFCFCCCYFRRNRYQPNNWKVSITDSLYLVISETQPRFVGITFLPRCMKCQRGLATRKVSVCLSVRPSVKRVICDKTKETCVNIHTPHERSFILVLWQEEWLVGATLSTWNCWSNWPRWSEKRRVTIDICS